MGTDFKEIIMAESEKYKKKIKLLNETIWENKANLKKLENWLENFSEEEKLQALYLLTQFIYIGEHQIKKMLVSIYRDFYKYYQVEKIRKTNDDVSDIGFINSEYDKKLKKTRFVALGNPSESSSLLMYSFRQENDLPKPYFITDNDIINCTEPIEDFIFIDDMCGSGSQAIEYSNKIVPIIKAKFPEAVIHYYMLAATEVGKMNIKRNSQFDFVDSIMNLDSSFKCFESNSRIFKNIDDCIDVDKIKSFCDKYGKKLMLSVGRIMFPNDDESDIDAWAEEHKLGFGNGQLLIGFNHNTPDNTLPIIWYNEKEINWKPIFIRKNKIYHD
ncbi:hypothetical protein AQ623_10795 [Flavobacterium columnare]|nr:hypothetical protein AQ623_10795 [Flavobacterium columnare]